MTTFAQSVILWPFAGGSCAEVTEVIKVVILGFLGLPALSRLPGSRNRVFSVIIPFKWLYGSILPVPIQSFIRCCPDEPVRPGRTLRRTVTTLGKNTPATRLTQAPEPSQSPERYSWTWTTRGGCSDRTRFWTTFITTFVTFAHSCQIRPACFREGFLVSERYPRGVPEVSRELPEVSQEWQGVPRRAGCTQDGGVQECTRAGVVYLG